mgnify:CR=1 FL=1
MVKKTAGQALRRVTEGDFFTCSIALSVVVIELLGWSFLDEIVCIACVYPALKDILHSLYKAFLDLILVMARNLLERSLA